MIHGPLLTHEITLLPTALLAFQGSFCRFKHTTYTREYDQQRLVFSYPATHDNSRNWWKLWHELGAP